MSRADAWDDLFLFLDEHWRRTGLGGIMHCFGGGWEQARRSLDLGFLVSFAGNLTYPKAQPLRDVAARMPLDAVLVETDAPWLAPGSEPRQAQRARLGGRDGPEVLAGLLNVTSEEIAAATTRNFLRLFPVQARRGKLIDGQTVDGSLSVRGSRKTWPRTIHSTS